MNGWLAGGGGGDGASRKSFIATPKSPQKLKVTSVSPTANARIRTCQTIRIGISAFFPFGEQSDLRGAFRWHGQTQMREGRRRQHAAAGRALHKTLLQQERFHGFLDRIARFAKRGRDGFDPDRPAAKAFRNQPEIPPVEGI